MIYVVEMNEWGCELYGGVGNLLTFVSFCDKNKGVQIICSTGLFQSDIIVVCTVSIYSPENTITIVLRSCSFTTTSF